jgi:hypothetical protein
LSIWPNYVDKPAAERSRKLAACDGREAPPFARAYSDVILRRAETTAGGWAHADLRASSTLKGGTPELRVIAGFPGEMEEGHLRRKSIPHSDHLFRTAMHWRMRAEKMRTLAKRLTTQRFGR